MKLSEELKWRGFVHQTTLGDLSWLDNQKQITFYHGYDASSDSQTIGNLAAMMFDRVFMRHGHKAIILAGGSTSLIGDPGGKDKERPLQSEAAIAHNVKSAQIQLEAIFHGHKFKLVNNLDWTKNLKVLDFLRDIGKHFSMTPLVQRDYITQRLGKGGSGISYAEFSYTILQGYDYLYLYDNYGCTLQLGGSDQWGNCLSGVELIRKARGKETHVITQPLVINKVTGKKFGKSEEGAIWLDSKKTSIYKFYQFWLNLDDAGSEEYLKLYTELSQPEVETIVKESNSDPASRTIQKRLAYEVTKLVHGAEQADTQQRIAKALSKQDVSELEDSETAILSEEIPYLRAKSPANLVGLLAKSGLALSNTDARRLISGGSVYINGQKYTNESVSSSDLGAGKCFIRRGKAYKDSILLELK